MSSSSTRNGAVPGLGSDWGGLSRHLIATFFAVKNVGATEDKTANAVWVRDMDQPEVYAPLTDGNIDIKPQWISPFENMNADAKFSSLSAMLQSGAMTSLLAEFQRRFPNFAGLDALTKQVKTLEGRSNLTKLNSTQVFQGMQPVSISVTAHFRAMTDPIAEVRDPVAQLIEWSVPKKIAANGPVISAVASNDPSLFPSEVPQVIGMKYADTLFAPLVIESAQQPLTAPRDANGIMTAVALPLQLATLTALDKQDWRDTRRENSASRFNY